LDPRILYELSERDKPDKLDKCYKLAVNPMDVDKIKLAPADFHPHLKARMLQRGVTEEEVEQTLRNGWQAKDAKPCAEGKVLVSSYNAL
jgi:hypothetical protein